MIKISLLSPPARHNEACEHGGRALWRIVGYTYMYSIDMTKQQEHFPQF